MNQKGMTLIQAMLSVFVSAIILASVAYVTINLTKVKSRISAIDEIGNELSLLQGGFAKSDSCTQIFANFLLTTDTPGNPISTSVPNSQIPIRFINSSHVTVSAINLVPVQKLETIVTGGITYEVHLMDLGFKFHVTSSSPQDFELKTRTIPIQVLWQKGTKRVISCKPTSSKAGTFCAFLGGVYSPTSEPPCQLPPFVSDCSTTEIAVGLGPSGFTCVPIPAGKELSGTAGGKSTPSNTVYVDYVNRVGSCKPAEWEIGRTATSTMCGRYVYVPPTSVATYAAVVNCTNWVNTNHHDTSDCVQLTNGTPIIHGFGPCLTCPF